MSHHLQRDDADFSDDVWEQIDNTVVGAAKSQMFARQILHTDGPHGLGLKALPSADSEIEEEATDSVTTSASCVVPVAEISTEFTLSARDISAFEQQGAPLDLRAVAESAIACARKEDHLIFHGSDALGVQGLLTADGTQTVELGNWDEVGTAAQDVINGVTELDNAGYHGPYVLALAPGRYNQLFRRYRQGNQTELAHIQGIVADGVVKAPALQTGGVLLASGKPYASIVLGQDLVAGFIGPAGKDMEFFLQETLALRLQAPGAVCILR